MDENLKDKVTARLSFFMLCAVCVQIEYHNMEIMEQMDISALILWEGCIPYDLMDTEDSISEDLKSTGSDTVWVRLPPVLPNILGIPSIKPQYMG